MAIEKVSTNGWSREEWEKDRQGRKTIGGSDAGTVLGLNEYKSPFTLWAEKKGIVKQPDLSGKEAVRLGNDLEDYVAKRFMEESGKKVRKDNHIWFNSDYPFAHANIDRLVVGEKALLECKTTGNYSYYEDIGHRKCPKQWYCQVMHYMMITGFDTAYIACICWGRGFSWMVIHRDSGEIAALAEAEESFYASLDDDEYGSIDDCCSSSTLETIKTIYREDSGESIDLSPMRAQLALYEALEKQVKDIEQQKDAAAVQIQQYMKCAAEGRCDNIRVTWKTATRRTFDRASFEIKNGIIPETFYKTSTYRTFKVTKK